MKRVICILSSIIVMLCVMTGCVSWGSTQEQVSSAVTVSSTIISEVSTSTNSIEEEQYITDSEIVFQRPAYKTEEDAEKILTDIIEDDIRYKGKYSRYYHMIGKEWKVYSCIDQLFERIDYIVLPISEIYPQTGYEFLVNIEMGQYPMVESCRRFIAEAKPEHENTL